MAKYGHVWGNFEPESVKVSCPRLQKAMQKLLLLRKTRLEEQLTKLGYFRFESSCHTAFLLIPRPVLFNFFAPCCSMQQQQPEPQWFVLLIIGQEIGSVSSFVIRDEICFDCIQSSDRSKNADSSFRFVSFRLKHQLSILRQQKVFSSNVPGKPTNL